MARKAPHIHRFTSVLHPSQWYYILWRYSFEKWTNHSTHYLSSRNEIPYHQGNLGIENCKKRTRQSLFWPLLNSEIEDTIKKWRTYLTFRNRQPSEPIINHPIPNQAWTKTDADPFPLYGHYLLIIDYNSKFIVIETLKDVQSSTVINRCKKIFSQFGTPKDLVANNSLAIISDSLRETGILNIEPLVRIFTNRMD